MKDLDRVGIFKARPLRWYVRSSQQSEAVALSMELLILAQWDGSAWTDWSACEEHTIYGDFWVVKGDGSINTQTVENLARAIGWYGDLTQVTGAPPAVIVQITVKQELYNSNTRLKVAWINPGDFSPTVGEVSSEDVRELQTRFGSLLRAAAAGAISTVGPTKSPTPASAPQPKTSKPQPASTGGSVDLSEQDDDCPF